MKQSPESLFQISQSCSYKLSTVFDIYIEYLDDVSLYPIHAKLRSNLDSVRAKAVH